MALGGLVLEIVGGAILDVAPEVGRLIGLTVTGGFTVAVGAVAVGSLLSSKGSTAAGGLIGLFGLPVSGLSFGGLGGALEVLGLVLPLEVGGFDGLIEAVVFDCAGMINRCPILTSGLPSLFASRIAPTLTPYFLAMLNSVSLAATTCTCPKSGTVNTLPMLTPVPVN